MTSLYKRASPQQHRILRIVEGAVKNAVDAHPGKLEISARHARSIAKRAAGTISAQWPELLAARCAVRPSASEPRYGADAAGPSSLDYGSGSDRSANQRPARRRASYVQRPSPLVRVRKELALRIGLAKKAGLTDRADLYIEILKLIALAQGHPVIGEKFSTRAEPWSPDARA